MLKTRNKVQGLAVSSILRNMVKLNRFDGSIISGVFSCVVTNITVMLLKGERLTKIIGLTLSIVLKMFF